MEPYGIAIFRFGDGWVGLVGLDGGAILTGSGEDPLIAEITARREAVKRGYRGAPVAVRTSREGAKKLLARARSQNDFLAHLRGRAD